MVVSAGSVLGQVPLVGHGDEMWSLNQAGRVFRNDITFIMYEIASEVVVSLSKASGSSVPGQGSDGRIDVLIWNWSEQLK